MTAAQEMALARELGIHFAAVGLSINWAAGIESTLQIVTEGMDEIRGALLALFIQTLERADAFDCACERSTLITHPPRNE